MKKRIFGLCLAVLTVLAVFALVGCGKCDHQYDNECDLVCNKCDKPREADGHVYDNACDARCNKCNEKRDIEGHKYGFACDTTCDNCGYTRKAAAHKYTAACDADCNTCGEVREPEPHSYHNSCSVECNKCGQVREDWRHEYSGPCAPRCMNCGEPRESYEQHNYTSACDTVCDGCGMMRFVDEPHIYDGTCDVYCNVCETPRIVMHSYSSNCDTDCDICGAIRTQIEHTWGQWQSNDEATCTEGGTSYRVCSVCSTREERVDPATGHDTTGGYVYNNDATHLKDGTKSKYCGDCGELLETKTATGTAGHNFGTDGKCKDCGLGTPALSAYMVYESFEQYQEKNSAFSISENDVFSIGSVKTWDRTGVFYTVVARGSGLAETNMRALQIARAASRTYTGNEAIVDFVPAAVLTSKHVIEFDIKIAAKHGADITICGAKTVGDETIFNEFVRYDAKNEQVIVCGIAVEKGGVTGSWHRVGIEIDDANRTFAIYIEGELIAGNLLYTDTSYPTSSSAVSFYRITASEGPSAVEFYLDNITVYNGAYRAN